IVELAEGAAKEPFDFQAPDYSDLSAAVAKAGEKDMRAAFAIGDKQERTSAVSAARAVIMDALTEEQQADVNLGSAMKGLEAGILRGDVVKTGKRIDGRAT
ncbi:MAG TPA: polyribonucleotide nucleotidyltransferase, partial [Sulfitobacter sp.]|nr:polyribonucleotide nucleotidyltransferase [Sulfitobacter sp.]